MCGVGKRRGAGNDAILPRGGPPESELRSGTLQSGESLAGARRNGCRHLVHCLSDFSWLKHAGFTNNAQTLQSPGRTLTQPPQTAAPRRHFPAKRAPHLRLLKNQPLELQGDIVANWPPSFSPQTVRSLWIATTTLCVWGEHGRPPIFCHLLEKHILISNRVLEDNHIDMQQS